MNSNKITVAKLTNALIEAGFITNFVEFDKAQPNVKPDWDNLDRPSRANVLASLIQTAYASVANAVWREVLSEKPLNTQADDGFPYQEDYAGSEPRLIQTLEEAMYCASEVRTMVRSYASDNTWLNGWAQRSFKRDAAGALVTNEHGERIMEEVYVNSFSQDIYDWSIMESDDPMWADKLLEVRARDIHVGWSHDGIDACSANFLEWANDVPWSPDADPRSRLERAIHKIGDKKWNELKAVLLSGRSLKGNEFKHWVLMTMSPVFQRDAKAVASSSTYRLYKMEQDIEKAETLEAEAQLLEMENKTKALLEARMNKLMGVEPVVAEPKVEAPKAEKPKAASRAPRTINNKGAAGGKFATH